MGDIHPNQPSDSYWRMNLEDIVYYQKEKEDVLQMQRVGISNLSENLKKNKEVMIDVNTHLVNQNNQLGQINENAVAVNTKVTNSSKKIENIVSSSQNSEWTKNCIIIVEIVIALVILFW